MSYPGWFISISRADETDFHFFIETLLRLFKEKKRKKEKEKVGGGLVR